MDIADLLPPDGVTVRAGASSKREVLTVAAELAAKRTGLPAAALLEALQEREALGSTGLGAGVAVPHARVRGLDRLTGVFVRLDHPVDFAALDDQPVDLVFALFAPEDAGVEHLRALAGIARRLREKDLRARLRHSAGADTVHALLANPTGVAA